MQIAARYTRTAMLLHWLIAALIAANLILVWTVDSLPEGWTRPIIDTHKSIGITVLGLVMLRILWRLTHKPPPLPTGYPQIERWGAHIVHWALYAVMLALPITGWLHDSAWKDAASHPMTLFGLVPWPRIASIMAMAPADKERFHDTLFARHAWSAYALYALLALHVGGALKHQFIDKHRELQRMWT